MARHTHRILALGLMLAGAAAPALAQAPAAPFDSAGAIVAPEERAKTDSMLSTKPVAPAPGLPWQNPAPIVVTQPGQQASPPPMPFGKSSAAQYEPIPEGPHSVTAVPVESIDTVEASEPAPAIAAPPEADPVNEDPAQPTELTAPIFAPDADKPALTTQLSVLNKVTARAERLTIKPGESATVGKLNITASHCQRSAPSSLPDAAAMLVIAEAMPDGAAPKMLFSGWMYQSSPSISALEHPVYDVTLVGCDGPAAKKAAEAKE